MWAAAFELPSTVIRMAQPKPGALDKFGAHVERSEVVMKKFAIATLALSALIAAPATAAELAVKAPPAPYVPPLYSWTGCYLGVHIGAGVHHADWTDEDFGEGSGAGVVGGFQTGCNYQIRQLVVGVEGEFYWSSLEAKHDDLTIPGAEFHAVAKNTRDASVALRLGYAFDRLLLYGKVGADWGRLRWTQESIAVPPTFGCVPTACITEISAELTVPGILLGTGFEYAFLDNWIAKLEYNYINFGHPPITFTQTCSGPGIGPADCPPFSHTRRDTKHILKVGLNYKFDWGWGRAPGYATY
jgi:outer membrane immunogenic protein